MLDDEDLSLAGDPTCHLTRNETALIIAVDDAVIDVLGWRPDQLVGSQSTTFVHPEDQVSALGAWLDMLAKRGSTVTWRGRYRTSDGRWQWVETVNTNLLHEAVAPSVETAMRRISVDQVSMAEELRTRRQLLARLADAVPVGIFQIDRTLALPFINDRLLDMFGPDPAASCEAQFRAVAADDQPLLHQAFETVLANQAVDGLELRFYPPQGLGNDTLLRVCLVSLRPLTDETGRASGAIGSVNDVTESVHLRRELEIRASIDGLTGCLNRQATIALLALLLGRPHPPGSGVGVIYMDIDRFKGVNDRYGHAAGDAAFREVVVRARHVIRTGDEVGRLGGDEFLIICPEVAGADTTIEVAERIATALRAPLQASGEETTLQASLGVAWTDGPASADGLVSLADQAMYHSKRNGHGRPVLAVDQP